MRESWDELLSGEDPGSEITHNSLQRDRKWRRVLGKQDVRLTFLERWEKKDAVGHLLHFLHFCVVYDSLWYSFGIWERFTNKVKWP